MPPVKKFQKEDIVNTALRIIETDGLSSVNARRLAKELGSSVQPIFRNFASMEELHKNIYEAMYNKYKAYMESGRNQEHEYKNMGLSYIRFAHDYPEFFKAIFMQETNLNAENFITADKMGDDVIKAGQKLTGLTFDEQKKFQVKVWIFTHGLACLVATKTISIKDEEIAELLECTVRETLIGYLNRKKEKNEEHNRG